MTQAPVTHAPSDSPHVLVLPPLLYGVALAAGLLLQWTAPRPIVASNARSWAGGVLLACGVWLAIWGRRVMDRAGTEGKSGPPPPAPGVAGPVPNCRSGPPIPYAGAPKTQTGKHTP